MKNIIIYFFLFCVVFTQNNQLAEIMSETPLHPIPEEMTYEEYQDMNRRINTVSYTHLTLPTNREV